VAYSCCIPGRSSCSKHSWSRVILKFSEQEYSYPDAVMHLKALLLLALKSRLELPPMQVVLQVLVQEIVLTQLQRQAQSNMQGQSC